jgi:hypothetical protein
VPSAATAVRSGAARPIAGHKNPPPSVGTLASSHGLAGVAGGPNPRDSGGLPAIWFFLKQRSSWVWFRDNLPGFLQQMTLPRSRGRGDD